MEVLQNVRLKMIELDGRRRDYGRKRPNQESLGPGCPVRSCGVSVGCSCLLLIAHL